MRHRRYTRFFRWWTPSTSEKVALLAGLAEARSMRGIQIHYVQCCVCHSEGACIYDEAGKPEMPATWRGMTPACCPDYEVYVCSPRCAMHCGASLLEKHETTEIIVRQVEEVMTMDSVAEMLEDCSNVESIPQDRGGPGYNQWELEFLESIREQLEEDEDRQLSEAQISKLTELWDRV